MAMTKDQQIKFVYVDSVGHALGTHTECIQAQLGRDKLTIYTSLNLTACCTSTCAWNRCVPIRHWGGSL